jgi:hypothetical protein
MSAVSQEAKLSIIRRRRRQMDLLNTFLFIIIRLVSGAIIYKIEES